MIGSILWFFLTIFGSGALVALIIHFLTAGLVGLSHKPPLTPEEAEHQFAKLDQQKQRELVKEAKVEQKKVRQKEDKKLEKIRFQEQQIQEELAQKQEELRSKRVLTKSFAAPVTEKEAPPPQSVLEQLKQGISKTRDQVLGGISEVVLGAKEIDEEVFDELEEVLLAADIGPETTEQILAVVTHKVERQKLKDPHTLKSVIKEEIVRILSKECKPLTEEKSPFVLLFVGVNGVGKTTTIGKIAAQYQRQGKKVLLGAGDTFRAAAIEQLMEWSQRSKCDIVAKTQGSDPSSTMYEALQKAIKEEYDVVICDTAGRLHNKKNLMEELKKMIRVMRKLIPDAPHEVFLVLDATTGQNALFQAKAFQEVAEITGLVITKLDGTAKGGVIIGIVNELEIPVRYIGIGEKIEDLRPYDAQQFAESLFS